MTHSWDDVIDACGGTGLVADGLSQLPSTVSGWRSRPKGIPGGHWAGIIRLASERGRSDVTLALLAEIAARELAEARP